MIRGNDDYEEGTVTRVGYGEISPMGVPGTVVVGDGDWVIWRKGDAKPVIQLTGPVCIDGHEAKMIHQSRIVGSRGATAFFRCGPHNAYPQGTYWDKELQRYVEPGDGSHAFREDVVAEPSGVEPPKEGERRCFIDEFCAEHFTDGTEAEDGKTARAVCDLIHAAERAWLDAGPGATRLIPGSLADVYNQHQCELQELRKRLCGDQNEDC
jgi:hypothetical protein